MTASPHYSDSGSAAGVTAPSPAAISSSDLELIVSDPLTLELRDDVADVVPTIPPQTFVEVLRQLRAEGRLDLIIPHASADQLTAVFDLGAWKRDRVDILEARSFLVEIVDQYGRAEHIERGDLAATMLAMDPEMWTLALHTGTSVLELDPEDDERRDLARRMVGQLHTQDTPDGLFLLATPDNAAGRQALHVIARIYEDSLVAGRRLVNSIGAALPSMLEEHLLQWRNGRLMDLGFVPWEEAMRLFRPLSVSEALTRQRDATPRPGLRDDEVVVELLRPPRGGLLQRVLDQLDRAELGTRAREFVLLVNEVMSAQRVDLADPAVRARGVDQTRSTLSLGLELLAAAVRASSPDGDAEALESTLAERVTVLGLRELFRVGYGPLVTLRDAATSLHREGRVSLSSPGSLLDRPWGPAIAAFSRWFPEMVLRSSAGAGAGKEKRKSETRDRSSGPRTRPLSSLRDVYRATGLIAEASALATLTFTPAPAGYGLPPSWVGRLDEPGRARLGDFLRTAVVLTALGEEEFNALTAAQVERAAAVMVQDGALAPSVRAEFLARATAAGVGDHGPALADVVLTRLGVELGSLERSEIDDRVELQRVGGLITVQQVGVWLKTGLTAT